MSAEHVWSWQHPLAVSLFLVGLTVVSFLAGLSTTVSRRSVGTKSRAKSSRYVIWLPIVGWACTLSYAIWDTVNYAPRYRDLIREDWILPVLYGIGAISLCVAFIFGPRATRWFDRQMLSNSLVLLCVSLLGSWMLQIDWRQLDGPRFGMAMPWGLQGEMLQPVSIETGGYRFTRHGGLVTVEQLHRDLRFTVHETSEKSNAVELPLDGAAIDATILLLLWLLCWPICHWFRAPRGRAMQIALVAVPVLAFDFVIEAYLSLVLGIILGYRLMVHLPRKAGSHRPAFVILECLGLFFFLSWLREAALIKFVALGLLPRWDVIWLTYTACGLMIGCCVGRLGAGAASSVQPPFSIDEWRISRPSGRALSHQTPFAWRWDTFILYIPYLMLGGVVLFAGFLREWKWSMEAVVAANVGLAVFPTYCVFRQKREMLAAQDLGIFNDEYRGFMTRISRASLNAGAIGLAEFTAIVVIPILHPLTLGLLLGLRSLGGLAGAGLAFCVDIGLSWTLLHNEHSRPAAVLLLGTSRPETIDLHARLAHEIRPYRVVSLLQVDQRTAEAKEMPPRRDCLRSIWSDGWLQIVDFIARHCVVVVLDATCA